MAIEIVSCPMKHGDVPYFFVCLPEGNDPMMSNTFEALAMNAGQNQAKSKGSSSVFPLGMAS